MSFLENTKTYVDGAAERLKLASGERALLGKPQNVLAFDLPLPMTGARTRVFKAWRVQHNNALGPYKGGIRYHPASSLDEVEALASLMTWKTSLVGIPYGGAKGAITLDPKELSKKELEAVSRSYVRRIVDHIGPKKDIPAPDVGTSPQIMAWMVDEYSKLVGHFEPTAFTGKPIEIGGSFGRDTATGFGGAVVLREFLRTSGKNQGAGSRKQAAGSYRVAVQGFGAVGSAMAQLLFKEGYRVVALSDSRAAIFNSDGIDIEETIRIQEERGLVSQRPCSLEEAGGAKCKVISNEELLELNVDILIPAALENVITEENASRIQAAVVLELANGPTAPEAERILISRDIAVIPDILANGGGVVGSYFEWVQSLARFYWEEEEVFSRIEKIMASAVRSVLTARNQYQTTWREAAYLRAVSRVIDAMRLRGWV